MHLATIIGKTQGLTTSTSMEVANYDEAMKFLFERARRDYDVTLGEWHEKALNRFGFAKYDGVTQSHESIEVQMRIDEMGTDEVAAEDIKPDSSNPVYLFVLCRNDMESLTGTEEKRIAGKACAQTGHAANQMVFEARKKNYTVLNRMVAEWEAETGMGFGTEIVKQGHFSDIKQVVEMCALLGHHAAMTRDPEYPLFDGKTLHFIDIETCGYVFGRKRDLDPILRRFPLLD
jgi:hypothetical protein